MKSVRTKGFLITQMLVVVAVIGVLGTIVVSSVGEARKRARDTERIHALNQIHGALQLYYVDHKKYPQGDGDNSDGIIDTNAPGYFQYVDPASPLGCNSTDDNTGANREVVVHSSRNPQGFLSVLVREGYLAKQWVQPSTPDTERYECRYVVDKDEWGDPGAGIQDNIQAYLLHCNLESGADPGTEDFTSPKEISDGGLNDSVYEVYSPGPRSKQFCPYGNDGRGRGLFRSQFGD